MGEMDRGNHRGIYSAITVDPEFCKLPGEARGLFLLLFHHPKNGPSGMFYMSMAEMEEFAGYSHETAAKWLEALIVGRWVLYDQESKVMWLRNTLRFDPSKPLLDKKKRQSIIKHLAGLPRSPLTKQFLVTYELAQEEGASELIEIINKLEGACGGGQYDPKKGASVALSSSPLLLNPSSEGGNGGKPKAKPQKIPVHGSWPSVQALADLYNEMSPNELMACEVYDAPKRVQKVRQFLGRYPERDWWVEVMKELQKSSFCRGLRNGKGHEGWRASFDWLFATDKSGAENVIKLFEGNYRS